MAVRITITSAGTNISSTLDIYTGATPSTLVLFESGVALSALKEGYTLSNLASNAYYYEVRDTGPCGAIKTFSCTSSTTMAPSQTTTTTTKAETTTTTTKADTTTTTTKADTTSTTSTTSTTTHGPTTTTTTHGPTTTTTTHGPTTTTTTHGPTTTTTLLVSYYDFTRDCSSTSGTFGIYDDTAGGIVIVSGITTMSGSIALVAGHSIRAMITLYGTSCSGGNISVAGIGSDSTGDSYGAILVTWTAVAGISYIITGVVPYTPSATTTTTTTYAPTTTTTTHGPTTTTTTTLGTTTTLAPLYPLNIYYTDISWEICEGSAPIITIYSTVEDDILRDGAYYYDISGNTTPYTGDYYSNTTGSTTPIFEIDPWGMATLQGGLVCNPTTTTTTLGPTTTTTLGQTTTTTIPETTTTTTQAIISANVNVINTSNTLSITDVTVEGVTVSGLTLPYNPGPGQSGISESVNPLVTVTVSVNGTETPASIQVTDGDSISYCQEFAASGDYNFNGIVFNGNTIYVSVVNLVCPEPVTGTTTTTTGAPTTTTTTTISATVNLMNASNTLSIDALTIDGSVVSGIVLPYTPGAGQSGIASASSQLVNVSISVSGTETPASVQVTDGNSTSYCQDFISSGDYNFNGVVFDGDTINISVINLACGSCN